MYSKVQYHVGGRHTVEKMYLFTLMDPWHISLEAYWNKLMFHTPWRMLHALDTIETTVKEGGGMPSIGK